MIFFQMIAKNLIFALFFFSFPLLFFPQICRSLCEKVSNLDDRILCRRSLIALGIIVILFLSTYSFPSFSGGICGMFLAESIMFVIFILYPKKVREKCHHWSTLTNKPLRVLGGFLLFGSIILIVIFGIVLPTLYK